MCSRHRHTGDSHRSQPSGGARNKPGQAGASGHNHRQHSRGGPETTRKLLRPNHGEDKGQERERNSHNNKRRGLRLPRNTTPIPIQGSTHSTGSGKRKNEHRRLHPQRKNNSRRHNGSRSNGMQRDKGRRWEKRMQMPGETTSPRTTRMEG